MKYPNTFSRWQQQFRLHRRVWSGIRKVLYDVKSRKRVLVSQEWPKGCDLFKGLVYLRTQKLVGLSHTAAVKRCCLDGIRKEWTFKANDHNLATNLMTPFCRCDSPEGTQITASGYYSKEVAHHILDAFQNVKLWWPNKTMCCMQTGVLYEFQACPACFIWKKWQESQLDQLSLFQNLCHCEFDRSQMWDMANGHVSLIASVQVVSRESKSGFRLKFPSKGLG